MATAQFESATSAVVDRSALQQARSFATMIVHLDVARDCEQRVQLALALADRFESTLIGVAGLVLRPAFAVGGIVVYHQPSAEEYRTASERLDEIGRRFRTKGQHLKQAEWRAALELPYELVSREARAADLIIVGTQDGGGSAHELVDPGAILLRAGRPILVVPTTVGSPRLRRVVVAWKDTRECRRAVRDALPFLRQAEDVLIVGVDEGQSDGKRSLSDVAEYLRRHGVAAPRQLWQRARGPVGAELLHLVRDEDADLIVAGGYGHSRLGEWIFGGVTHQLLTSTPVCCLLSH